jgi:hypothetical protein
MRLVALVQQGSRASNAMFVLLPYSRCKVTYDVRCLVISMFQVYQKVALALLQPLGCHGRSLAAICGNQHRRRLAAICGIYSAAIGGG